MILHGEDWKFFVANAFHRLIVQIDVRDLESCCAGHALFLSRNRESVVL